MTDTTPVPTPPAVPPIVRTVAYFILLGFSAAVLRRGVLDGRGTTWCPVCQRR